MKRNLLLLAFLAVIVATLAVNAARMGTLTRDSEVWTTTEDIVAPSVSTGNGFPVFEIPVPDGKVEVQVRAGLRNFEPGFLLWNSDTQTFLFNYVPTGATVAGRKVYQALGAAHVATWNVGTARWTFGYLGLYSTNTATDPWDIPGNEILGGGNYVLQKEFFVYRTCTTGQPQDLQWGVGAGDPDPWVYFSTSSGDPNTPGTEFPLQKWNTSTQMQGQMQSGGTPGLSILFQPSRGNLGASEWMQQNKSSLIWIYQVQGPTGVDDVPKQPNDAHVWQVMHPKEWRKARITLTP